MNVLFVGVDISQKCCGMWNYKKDKYKKLYKKHLSILKGFRTAAHQSWHILRVVRESNPGQRNRFGPHGLGSIPGRRKVCANFDELQF